MLIATKGQRFGRLVLTGYSAMDEHRILRVEAQCDCGTVRLYRMSGLKRGDTRSCGCLRRERPNRLDHGMVGTRLYRIWKNMLSRCRTPHQRSYQAKGLSVCAEMNFPDDQDPRPDVGCLVKAIAIIGVLAVLALVVYMGGVA